MPLVRVNRPGAKNTRVPVCALLAGSTETCLADLFRAAARGVRTFKLKVGRGTVDEEADRIRRMHEALPREAVLRLDANRAWSLATARELARRLPQVQPVFVEEPLAEVARLRDFYDATGWPLALDETLHGLRPDQEVPAIPGVVAWVLKPTLMRCLEDVMSWQDKAVQAGVAAIISASYESGVGIRMLAELAGRSPDTAAGLDTYRFLAEDVLEPRLDIDSGVIDLRDARALAVQTLRLKRVL
jgi:O-succinylbenzoate synthase